MAQVASKQERVTPRPSSAPLTLPPRQRTLKGFGMWAFLAVLVVALTAAGIAALTIYAFALRDDDPVAESRRTDDLELERDEAAVFAARIATVKCGGGTCGIAKLDHVAPRIWRVQLAGNRGGCYVVDLDRFILRNGPRLTGVAELACSSAPLQKRDVLSVAARASSLPFLAQGLRDPTGFEADLIETIARRLRIPRVEWGPAPSRNIFARSRKVDLAVGQVVRSGARRRNGDYTVAYYPANMALMVRKRSSPTVRSLDAVRRLRLGYFGGEADPYVRTVLRPRRAPRGFSLHWRALEALEAGRVDALIMPLPFALELARAEPPRFEVVAQLDTKRYYSLLVAKGSVLLGPLNRTLKAMYADGTLKSLQEKWIPGSTRLPAIP